MCAVLLDIRRMITSHTGQNVFFEISGVRCAAAVCMTAVTSLHAVVEDFITKSVYNPIVGGVRDELILLSGALGFTIPVGFMSQLPIACQFRSVAMPVASFVKLMAIVCAIALSGYDLSQCTIYSVLKTVPTLPAMLETCDLDYKCMSKKRDYYLLGQIHKLFTTMFKSKKLGPTPLGKYMGGATAAVATTTTATAAVATTTTATVTTAAAAAKAAAKAAANAKRNAAAKAKRNAATAARKDEALKAEALKAEALTMFKK